MIRNYLITAFRNLLRNKTSSAINIFGLTIGLSSCLLIALYIQHELNYDKFQQKGNRIARVIMEYSFGSGTESKRGNFTSIRVATVFKKTFPEVADAARMANSEKVIAYKDKLFNEKYFVFADPSFLDIFSFRLLQGNPHTALAAPYQMLISASAAKKYFGEEDPVGKILRAGTDSNLYQVTGIIQDCPSNSQIKYDFVASFSSLGLGAEYENSYWDSNYITYLLLRDKPSIATLQSKLPAFMKKEMPEPGATINFYLEPFTSVHLHSEYGGFEPNNNIMYIYILAALAALILIIVCSTYINLGTARSVERAKEVGVRKVIGAGTRQLFWQFMGESVLTCTIAVAMSIGVALLVIPWFNQLTDKQLEATKLLSLPFLILSILIVIITSFLAGTYPALMLTGFQPSKVLKGAFKNSGSGLWLRKSLIVFQFAISVFMIVATFITQRQLNYIQHKKLGYDREHVLVLPIDNVSTEKLSVIKQELKTNPEIISVSRCVRNPIEGGGGYNMRSDSMTGDNQIAVTANPVDEDFVSTTGLEIIAGNNLSGQDIKDVTENKQGKRIYHFILNESAASQLGWTPQQAIGKKLFLGDNRPGFVKAVVKDFHFESLHNPIHSFILFPEARGRELLLKLSGQHLTQTISFLATKWKTLSPDRPFEYHFMDEDFTKLYSAELRLGKVMDLFAAIAIVLACLGLLGLSSYSAKQRFKEIAIRKVLGASAGNIVVALSQDFIRLAVIAIVIAFPLAWWTMTKWLQDFTYRTDMGWGIYLAAAIITVLLALITVSIHAIKAAVANPVRNLRTE